MIFLTKFNFHHLNTKHNMVFEKPNKGFVIQVRRKILQVVQATVLLSLYAVTLLGSREHRQQVLLSSRLLIASRISVYLSSQKLNKNLANLEDKRDGIGN